MEKKGHKRVSDPKPIVKTLDRREGQTKFIPREEEGRGKECNAN